MSCRLITTASSRSCPETNSRLLPPGWLFYSARQPSVESQETSRRMSTLDRALEETRQQCQFHRNGDRSQITHDAEVVVCWLLNVQATG